MAHHQLLSTTLLTLALGSCALACATLPPEERTDDRADNNAVGRLEDPERLGATLGGPFSWKLAANIDAQDVGRTFGVEDSQIPYPDTYWPMERDGINDRWNGVASPLEKYMTLTDPANLRNALSWNSLNAGKSVNGIQYWNGFCDGWSAAAIAESPIKHAIFAQVSENVATKCSARDEGKDGCVKFEIGDLNALMAIMYSSVPKRMTGSGCNTDPNLVQRDGNGRVLPEREGAGCKGLNPGALLVILSHRMKRDKKAIVINNQGFDEETGQWRTNEIWNQPAYRYTVNRFEPVSSKEAANLTITGERTGSETTYRWNNAAKAFAYVDFTVHWVGETEKANINFVSGKTQSEETRMTAVIELNQEATSPNSTILGGELTEDRGAGTHRLKNHPYVWLPSAPPQDGPTKFNQFVKPSIVRQLLKFGRE